MESFNINKYSINISNCDSPYAYIMLYSDSVSSYYARLNFLKRVESNNYECSQEGDLIRVNCNIKLLDTTIDLLRNEKPLTFSWSINTGVCIIGTGKEPVGESELKQFPKLVLGRELDT